MVCIFCKIARGEAASYTVHEDDLVIAFLDRRPLSPGHTLVVPKKHVETIADIDDESLARVTATAKRLAILYSERLGAQGFNLRNSSGAAAGQDVLHFHLHLVPRYEGDGLDLIARHSGQPADPGEAFERIVRTTTKHPISG